MPNLEDIAKTLGNDAIIDMDKIGEQQGAARFPLPPGTYQFEVNADQKELFSKEFDVAGRGKRSNLMLDLTVTHAKDNALIGEQRRYRISGAERNRARQGQPERFVSDLQFFYRDALGGTAKVGTFLALCREVVGLIKGAKFVADVEWSTYCNKKNVRWIDDPQGGLMEDPSGTLGCGANYYQSQLASTLKGVDGSWLGNRITCSCGANLRVNDELTRFRKAQG